MSKQVVIDVNNLAKHFSVPEKAEGFGASIKSLFNRKYKTVKAVDKISFSIDEGTLLLHLFVYPDMVILGRIPPGGAGALVYDPRFGAVPEEAISGGMGTLLNIVFPITLAAAVPVEFLFGKMPWYHLGIFVVSVVVIGYLTRRFWQYSIKKYSSFSS